MARGRGNAYAATMLLMMVGLQSCSLWYEASAATYTVGGSKGWDVGVDYTSWAAGQTFKVGDVLFFPYLQEQHDVTVVDKAGYDACSAANAIATFSDGNSSVTLSTAGAHYYLCSFVGHCSAGMKLAVTVTAAAAPPTSPSAPPISRPSAPPPSSAVPPTVSPPPMASPPPTPSRPPATAPSPSKTPSSSPTQPPSPAPSTSTPGPSPAPFISTPSSAPYPAPASVPALAPTPSSPASAPTPGSTPGPAASSSSAPGLTPSTNASPPAPPSGAPSIVATTAMVPLFALWAILVV